MGASEGLSIVIPYELTIMLTAVSILAIYHYSYNQAMHYDAYVYTTVEEMQVMLSSVEFNENLYSYSYTSL